MSPLWQWPSEKAIGKLKMCIKKNGIGNSNDQLQQFVSSLNNASSIVTKAGCAAKRLLGFKPRYDLPRAAPHLTDAQREAMLLAVQANRDRGPANTRI